jgi:glycosyltransferase involved in cell wall biosynthesis
MSPPSRLRALVLAELCNPEWVSGPLVGWHHALALSREVDVHLVTHGKNREGIERSGWPKDRVTFIEMSRLEQLKMWMTREVLRVDHTTQAFTAVGIPFYWRFEQLAWKQFGRALEAREFDVVHRLTPVSPVVSSPIARRCARIGVPFVLGPINGGLPWPRGYENALHKEREFVSRLRTLYRFAPYLPSTWKNSAALLVASRTTWDEIPHSHHGRCFYVTENGIPASSVLASPRETPRRPLRAVFVGRLVPLKCVDVALRGAAPLIRSGEMVFDVVGDGSERGYLESVAKEEGIADKTTFHGWLEHAETMKVLSTGHVLLFPSIREFGGGVVVEAMSLGVVPLVMSYGGPGEIVDEGSGYRLPLASSEDTAREITGILRRLLADPGLWQKLSDGSRQRVFDAFTWEAKARMSVSVYEHVLGRAPRPTLGPPSLTH